MTKELKDNQNSYKVDDSSVLDKKKKPVRGGRYVGTSPMKAAAKAAKRMFARIADDRANYGHNNKDTIVFKLLQTTRGSDHKEYIYKAKKLKGKVEMVTINIKGTTLQVPKSNNIEVEPATEDELVQAMRAAQSAVTK